LKGVEGRERGRERERERGVQGMNSRLVKFEK
jgi:hypothetical protein